MKPPTTFVVLLLVWLALFALSIILAAGAEPTGDGFTRGMNRTTTFLKWQLAAFVIALVSFFMTRRNASSFSTTLQFIGKTPFYTHCVILVFVVGMIVYAVLTN